MSMLSCDWGSTSFRLRLLDANGKIRAAVNSQQGASTVAGNESDPQLRAERFANAFRHARHQLEEQVGKSLQDLPAVVSGMATSAHGWYDLPYATLPFPLDGSTASSASLSVDGQRVTLLSGICSGNDVMRGEEAELLGLSTLLPLLKTEKTLVILPGTHSKHVFIEEGEIRDFRTIMNGELFALLCNHSVLGRSLANGQDHDNAACNKAFADGLRCSSGSGSFIATLFQVRVRTLLAKASADENVAFLNGLLLADELRNLEDFAEKRVIVCAPEKRLRRYCDACRILYPNVLLTAVTGGNLDHLVPLGHQRFLKQK